MFGRFSALLFLLLLAEDSNFTNGSVFEVKKFGKLKACVSDKTVAFVKKPENKQDFTKVDVVDLDGNPVLPPDAKYDCNLVIENGCQSWEWKSGWKSSLNTENSLDPYPMVTDFRWHDLPTYFPSKKFESKITIRHQYFKLHFSILAHDSAQFLLTNDSTFEKGYRAVIDGWGNTHQSELQYCTAIYNANLERWPICEVKLKIVQNQIILDGGKNWVHAEVKSEQQSPGEIEYRAMTNTLTINFPDYRKNNYRTENYLSFRTNEEGLFKLHKYNVLLPFESSKLMELALKSDLPNAFCIDFVFLTTMEISEGNQAFEIEIKNARRNVIFNENIITTRKNEWTTARIFRNDIKLRKDWTITLTAHTRELVIGGIKFCKEGFMVYKPKIENPNHCQSLVKEADTTAEQVTDHFTKIWSEPIDCKKLFGGDCVGFQLCHQEEYCACYAGYQGNNCEDQCHGTMFGLNCSQFSQRKCFKENLFPTNGTCREGCAAGYSLPDCIDGCTGNKYGINCYNTSSKKCLNNDINRVDGSCLQGCADGYYPPCEKACERNSYGKNCGNTSYKNCKDDLFNHVDGSCLKGCKEGYSFPDCINECEGNSYGVNCSKTSTKHCFGAKLNRATGNCLNGCEDGYSFPACEKECNGAAYGKNCLKISERKCLGGKYSSKDGRCREGCAYGYREPDCIKECNEGWYGKNCAEKSNRSCLHGNYSRTNGLCLEGCQNRYIYPDCEKEIQTATPQLKMKNSDKITLDIASSLKDTSGITDIIIQYKKTYEVQWTNISERRISSAHEKYSLSNLKPNTNYEIRFALFENDAVKYPENFLPGKQLKFWTKCRPIGKN
ncbi:uncharacterized protein LOC135942125 [Cloeon dipterum]|uniref:uncharacterized protein LOC135942125 n=1 Tax=Cloeon dipterum TaxID=197152 RepID=UPI003220563A